MKLYLTSYRIPDPQALSELVGKPLTGISVALLPNAKDYYALRARAVKIRQVRQYLEGLGLTVAVVDLNEVTSKEELEAELSRYDMLWAMGGNSFCLREAMRRSGFDDVVGPLLRKGLVYAGESAGACVAGTDLKGVDMADDDEFAEEVIWDGLGLVPVCIVPHVDNPDFGPLMQEIIATRPKEPEVIALNDNQAWIVDGGSIRTITGVKPGQAAS